MRTAQPQKKHNLFLASFAVQRYKAKLFDPPWEKNL